MVEAAQAQLKIQIAIIREKAASNDETFPVIYRKLMSLNPFPVIDLRPEVELMRLLRKK